MAFVLIIFAIWFPFWVAIEIWDNKLAIWNNRLVIILNVIAFPIMSGLVIGISYFVIYLLFYCGIIGWIMATGIIYFFAYYGPMLIKKKEEKESKKKIANMIHKVEKSNVVLIGSSKQYAIPLHASIEGISVLQISLENTHQPTVVFSEKKHSLSNILLFSENPKNIGYYTVDQISSVAKDLYLNIEPQREDLKIKLTELKKLEKLASFSELYTRQADLYFRAGKQVKELLDANEKLSRECHSFILDILIGQELIEYDINNFPDVLEIKISLDYRCKKVSDQYQLLRSEMDEYVDLRK
jgi:hypothetical protein